MKSHLSPQNHHPHQPKSITHESLHTDMRPHWSCPHWLHSPLMQHSTDRSILYILQQVHAIVPCHQLHLLHHLKFPHTTTSFMQRMLDFDETSLATASFLCLCVLLALHHLYAEAFGAIATAVVSHPSGASTGARVVAESHPAHDGVRPAGWAAALAGGCGVRV